MFQNLGENQIKEIINSSKLSIFFIDERQRGTLKDVGSVQMIEEFSRMYGAKVTKAKLESKY